MPENKKYFLGQDVYSNWYCLPESKREIWNRLINKVDVFNYDGWDEIEKHKINIDKLIFENPQLN